MYHPPHRHPGTPIHPNHPLATPTLLPPPPRRTGRLPRTLLRFILLPQRRQLLSTPPLQRVFPLIIRFVGVDFEEMIEDNQEHGQTTEEDGERVELVVGYHILRVGGGLGAKGTALDDG